MKLGIAAPADVTVLREELYGENVHDPNAPAPLRAKVLPRAGIATRKVKWDRKYQQKHGITTGAAPDLSAAQTEQLSRLAKRVYRALHMNGFARMDFRMHPDGTSFLLEANANPNLTRDEDLAESAKTEGVSYEALLQRIVSLGLSYMPEWRMFEG